MGRAINNRTVLNKSGNPKSGYEKEHKHTQKSMCWGKCCPYYRLSCALPLPIHLHLKRAQLDSKCWAASTPAKCWAASTPAILIRHTSADAGLLWQLHGIAMSRGHQLGRPATISRAVKLADSVRFPGFGLHISTELKSILESSCYLNCFLNMKHTAFQRPYQQCQHAECQL